MTKTFGTDVLLSMISGKLLCSSFGDVQLLGDFLTQESTFTHNYASKSFWDALRAEIVRQLPWTGEDETLFATYPDLQDVSKPEVEKLIKAWLEPIFAEHGREQELQVPTPPVGISFTDGWPTDKPGVVVVV